MWHLEVALPELAAASNGSSAAKSLASVAAAHLDSAAANLEYARAGMPARARLSDAALGASLTSSAQALRADGTAAGAVADIASAARLRLQQGIDELLPMLRSDEELLPLSPAATAPHGDLALIDTVADARRFKEVSPVQRALVKRILAEGTIDPEPIRMVGGYGNGNGQMAMVRVRHPDTPHLSVVAVQRPPTAQAAQEEFFARLAEHAGVDQHYAPVARRADGSALVLAVPGHQLWDDVHSGEDIAAVMANWYRDRFPSLTDDAALEAGTIDFGGAQSLDYLTAQPDRNAGALLGDVAGGEFHFIDNGFAGRGEMHDVLKPGLKSHFVGGASGRATLHPVAAREISTRLDDAKLADAHAVLRRGPDGDLPAGHALALRQDANVGYLEAMRARRDQVARGFYEYEPIDLHANPLAHMDWLRGGRAHPFDVDPAISAQA